MDFLTPPIYDVSNIDMWKYKMSMYLKTLGMHVYLSTTKKSYLSNSKHIEANVQTLEALRCTLSKKIFMYGFSLWFRLCSVEHFDLSKASNAKLYRGGI